MDAFRIGPAVVSAPRFYAAVALVVLIGLAELVAWRRGRRGGAGGAVAGSAGGAAAATAGAGWAWSAAAAALLGARVAFVVENAGYFAARPLEAFQFWQGGFSAWWGVAAAAVVAAATLTRDRRRGAAYAYSAAALPVSAALAAWLLVPALFVPVQQAPRPLPAVALESLAGEVVGLSPGQPLVVNEWATWCLPCRRELPQLARAAEEAPGVKFLLVNQGEGRAVVEAFLADYPAVRRGDVLLDRGGVLAAELRGVGLPTTYFFSAAGTLLGTHVGEISGAALERWVRRLQDD